MKVVVQRSKAGRVIADGEISGHIDRGLMVLVGVTHDDSEEDVRFCADKVTHLRIFEDDNGKMNHSVLDEEGQVLSVSQFTLYGDCRKGRRPNFMNAAKPDEANRLYEKFNERLRDNGLQVETGRFGAMMDVEFTNDGPVTLIVDSKE
ncbi:D-tyrosyl-tRNA(Tyr) deacylase [Alteribacter lacisalsi]|uniref:D-aminoacyl-tRNA deacylase n=1 Tax=Alteribacter lacisalsi TaxID=2045244 RepID=A0A2W0HYC3_9BACI|nr:D-aminoacyl-tRNA deacylase [Alteribacter lacisalsi]PYZ98798.1 D-tyrosyl-tRNA(Tyr) deacylase [Alteribacter lacisalsi]